MSNLPRPNEVYKHFKGNLYEIIEIAEHSETGEQLVIYRALYGEFKVYARPLNLFTGKVDKVKYPEAVQEYRFELQTKQDLTETEELTLDPLIIQFLDTDSYEERLNILTGLHHRITNDMITTMAIVCDVEVPEGELEDRYQGLKNCLVTLEKYECNRLR